MEDRFLSIKATDSTEEGEAAISTQINYFGLDESQSEDAAHFMFAILNRIAYEWMKNGMDRHHCFNLFLHAAREAESQIENENR